ncbi:hypothetical protein CSC12_1432 [Klebsiella michiganensis]|nr:hypothetical protein CSC12_1432 [Klebsiella michiganensis]
MDEYQLYMGYSNSLYDLFFAHVSAWCISGKVFSVEFVY